MKITYFLTSAMLVLLSGCVSTVKTYDANGKMIGSCEAHGGFLIGAAAGCSGTANQEGK